MQTDARFSLVSCQFGENAHMYFICIVCLNGSERLHRNNNVQWIAEHGVRLLKFLSTRAFLSYFIPS